MSTGVPTPLRSELCALPTPAEILTPGTSKCEYLEMGTSKGRLRLNRVMGWALISRTGVLVRGDQDTDPYRGQTTRGHSEKMSSSGQGERTLTNPADTSIWTSRLQNSEKINFCCLSHAVRATRYSSASRGQIHPLEQPFRSTVVTMGMCACAPQRTDPRTFTELYF